MATSSPTWSPLPTLFVLEGAANFIGGAAMFIFPRNLLRLLSNGAPTFPLTRTSEPSASSVQLLQWVAVLFCALGVPLLTGAADTTRARASRRMVYHTLAAGEIFLVGMMLWQAGTGDVDGGISRKFLWAASGLLGAIALGRGWVLGWKQEWFQDGTGPSHKRRTSNR